MLAFNTPKSVQTSVELSASDDPKVMPQNTDTQSVMMIELSAAPKYFSDEILNNSHKKFITRG
jgi:hypothetical protein